MFCLTETRGNVSQPRERTAELAAVKEMVKGLGAVDSTIEKEKISETGTSRAYTLLTCPPPPHTH